jgi:hypothetical protein
MLALVCCVFFHVGNSKITQEFKTADQAMVAEIASLGTGDGSTAVARRQFTGARLQLTRLQRLYTTYGKSIPANKRLVIASEMHTVVVMVEQDLREAQIEIYTLKPTLSAATDANCKKVSKAMYDAMIRVSK